MTDAEQIKALEAEIARLTDVLACVADHATGGRLSKTNYEKKVYYDAIDEHVNKCVDEAIYKASEMVD